MRLMHFDQFEFEHWESEESFSLAYELKKVRGSCIKSLEEFYQRTKTYKEFVQWQEDSFTASKEVKVTKIEKGVIFCCENLCGVEFSNDQFVFMHHNEWDLQDILWGDQEKYYRATWCTTA